MLIPSSSTAPRRLFSLSGGTWHRDAFLIWYPLVLAGSALTRVLWPHPLVLFAVVAVGATIACAALVALCTARAKLSISRLLGAGLLQGYAVGALPDAFGTFTAASSGAPVSSPQAHTYALALCQIYLGVAVL